MNRRNFINRTTAILGAIAAAPFIDLGDTFSPSDLVTHPDITRKHDWHELLLDLMFENIKAPELGTGTLNISLHTSYNEIKDSKR